MPVYRNRLVVELLRNARAFLSLEAGVTRGKLPEPLRNGQASQGLDRLRQQVKSKDKEIERLKERLKRANVSVPSHDPRVDSPQMFFLVGRAKSGTSWLMRLLHSHPEILCRGEGKLFGKDSHKSLHHALAHSEKLQWWLNHNPWTWREEDPNLEDLTSVLIHYLMAEKLHKTKRQIVGDKTPLESQETVEDIAFLCPGAKVAHIIRDGRDTAVSTVHHLWNNATDRGGPIKLSQEQAAKREAYRSDPSAFGPGKESIFGEGQVAQLARNWSMLTDRVRRDGPRLLGMDYYELKYEDLLVRPVEGTRRLLEFLGADAGEGVVQRCVEANSFEKFAKRKPGEEDSASFYRKGVAGDWRSVFTDEDRQTFKEEAGEMLVRLGYEKDQNW